MMTYNPPYYGRLIENYGFRKVEDMYAFWGHIDMISKLDKKLWFIANEATRTLQRHRARRCNRNNFRRKSKCSCELYNASLAGTWGFVPLSADEIKVLGAGLKHLIAPELAVVAEVNGEPIGVVLPLSHTRRSLQTATIWHSPLMCSRHGKRFSSGSNKSTISMTVIVSGDLARR